MDTARGGVVAISDALESQLSGTVLFCHLCLEPQPQPFCKWMFQLDDCTAASPISKWWAGMRATGPQQWALTLSRTGKSAGCLGGVVVTVSL